jgi:hypothetical protein
LRVEISRFRHSGIPAAEASQAIENAHFHGMNSRKRKEFQAAKARKSKEKQGKARKSKG